VEQCGRSYVGLKIIAFVPWFQLQPSPSFAELARLVNFSVFLLHREAQGDQWLESAMFL
jgi:hypothetical protein